MSEINTHKMSVLSGLFEQSKIFEVPHFQRSYAWERDLTNEFWEDIYNTVLDEQINREHFMGAFIFSDAQENGNKNEGPIHEWIIDGQQRMITLTILFRAMHDSLNKGSDLAGHILDLIIGGRYEKNEFYRLTLGEDVADFFERYIQDKNPTAFRESRKGKKKVEKRIIAAYKFFLDAIRIGSEKRGWDSSKFVDYLFRKLKERVVAVRIKVQSDADAYAIFETINSKKVELSVSELLKNYVFLQSDKIGGSALRNTRKKWDEMIENLSQDEEIEPSQFIRHYWISNEDSVSEKNLYRAIKVRYNNDKEEIKHFVSYLAEESALYAKLVGGFRDDDDEIIDEEAVGLLNQIKSLRIKQCYPMLLSALSSGLPKGQFKELLRAVARVSLMRGLADLNPNELEDVYSKGARSIRAKNKDFFSEIIKEIKKFIPEKRDIERAVLENEISEQIARFILTQYEMSKRTGETKTVLGKTSLEHILPQSPDDIKDWGMTLEEHSVYVGRLGNLTLVAPKINQKASNRPFAEKKKILEKSEIKITIELAKQYQNWSKQEIQKRTSELLEFVFLKWA